MGCQLMGANAKLYLKEEPSYGTSPSGNYQNLPFISSSLGGTDDVDQTVILGLGRDKQRPSRNSLGVTGNIVVPLDTLGVGYWLKGMFGAATVTGGPPDYTHLFQSGKQALPSYTVVFEQSDASPTIYSKYIGVVVNTMAITIGPTGRPQLELGVIAQDEVEDNVNISGTPTTFNPKYYTQKQGAVTLNGTAFAKATSVSVNANNNYETTMYAGGGGKIGCADPGQFDLTGQFVTRINDLSVVALAQLATLVDLALAWSIDVHNVVTFEFDAADLIRNGNGTPGPGAKSRTFNIIGSKDVAEADSLRVSLVTQQATF